MTDKQYAVLKAIATYRNEFKIPPTLADVAEKVGTSRQNVGVIVKKLIAAGRLEHGPGKHRNLLVIKRYNHVDS